jgi:hypothetical protein
VSQPPASKKCPSSPEPSENVPKKKACLSIKEEETHETAKATDLDVQVPSSRTAGEPTGAAPMEAASENGTRAHDERSSESNYAMLRALISKIGNDRAEERDVALTSEERTSHYGGVSAWPQTLTVINTD